MSDAIGICIPNYRMPERTDALVEHIQKTCKWPHEFFIADMLDGASDYVHHSKYATVGLYKDLQMNAALTMAVAMAKGRELVNRQRFLGYWFITTSMNFIDGDTTDILTILAEKLFFDYRAVIVSPALDGTSGTAWTNMLTRGGSGWRQTLGMDALATMYRADFFNSMGGYDPDLTMGWGGDMELSWKARMWKRTAWISEDCKMHKERSVAAAMGRWHETPLEREERGRTEMDAVLGAKYGPAYIEKLMKEYVTPEMGTL